MFAVAKSLTLCYSFKLPWRRSSLYKCLVLNGLWRILAPIAEFGPCCPVEILWKTPDGPTELVSYIRRAVL